MITLAEPNAHIEFDSRGRARVVGTRSKVASIAIDHVRGGMSAKEIVESYPHLNLAQVHAALSYYFDHQAEIDREIEASLRENESLRAKLETPEYRERVRSLKQRFDGLKSGKS